MIKIYLYAFFTGVYFALLQFCYFLGLQINIKSTYETYMTVVVAWMSGTIVGLWWDKLNVIWLCVGGLVAYYAVGLQILNFPYSWPTMPLATLGIIISGLWAGRFFLHALSKAKNTDKLFFHENNGFLIGVLGAFIGFTTLGRKFLWFAPILAWAAMMLIFYLTLACSPQQEEIKSRSRNWPP